MSNKENLDEKKFEVDFEKYKKSILAEPRTSDDEEYLSKSANYFFNPKESLVEINEHEPNLIYKCITLGLTNEEFKERCK